MKNKNVLKTNQGQPPSPLIAGSDNEIVRLKTEVEASAGVARNGGSGGPGGFGESCTIDLNSLCDKKNNVVCQTEGGRKWIGGNI